MEDDPGPDRSRPREQQGRENTDDESDGEDGVDAVGEREEQSAERDRHPRGETSEQYVGDHAAEQQLLSDRGHDGAGDECQEEETGTAPGSGLIAGLNVLSIARRHDVHDGGDHPQQVGRESEAGTHPKVARSSSLDPEAAEPAAPDEAGGQERDDPHRPGDEQADDARHGIVRDQRQQQGHQPVGGQECDGGGQQLSPARRFTGGRGALRDGSVRAGAGHGGWRSMAGRGGADSVSGGVLRHVVPSQEGHDGPVPRRREPTRAGLGPVPLPGVRGDVTPRSRGQGRRSGPECHHRM